MKINFRKLTIKEKYQIIKMIEEWCKEYNIHSGECLCQSDNGNLYSPILVAEIIDEVLKPEVVW